MGETLDFLGQLKSAVTEKAEWFNQEQLVKLIENYRLLHLCVHNLYDMMIKRSLITPDPYKNDRKISGISAPESTPFPESERGMFIGARFSEYESMLDYICTYVKFSVDFLDLQRIKKLNELNGSFQWNNMTINNTKINTRGLAELLQEARQNSSQMQLSMISDSVAKCASALNDITAALKELSDFQRENYKVQLRLNVFEHPNFDKAKAFSSPENEVAEIKKMFPSVMGKMPYYSELINEIVEEDQSPNKEKLQEALFNKLKITRTTVKKEKTVKINTKEIILDAVHTLTGLSDVYEIIAEKLSTNVNIIEGAKNTFGAKIKKIFRQMFNIKEPDLIYNFIVVDAKKGTKQNRAVNIRVFITNLLKKSRFFTALSNKAGPEYKKLSSFDENSILEFANKNIVENQEILALLDAGDVFFKQSAQASDRNKIKGLKMDLITVKNTVVKAIQKRGEYISYVEEEQQMKKLGITNEE